jgi:hypothetical protein
MKVKNYQGGTLIILSEAFDSRDKTLFFFYFLVFFVTGIFSIGASLNFSTSPAAVIISLFFGAATFVGAYRFINKALLSERMFIDGKDLFLITLGLTFKKRQTFDLALISNFRLLEKPEMAKHPLAGQSFDYLGFQTEQQVINEMYGDNRLAFDYEGRTIQFGKDIYSWDFDEIKQLLNPPA